MRLCYGLMFAFVAGCGGGSSTGTNPPPPPPGPGTTSVSISDAGFVNQTISVKVGETVRWTNNGAMSHSVVANDNSFNSGVLAGSSYDPYSGGGMAGGVYARMFSSQGTFAYHCGIHSSMTGTVTVTP